jgi:transketolase
MSCLDILTVLYYDVMNVDPENPKKPDRDRFFLSKGHSVEGYWAILGDRGFFPRAWLATFSRPGSLLIGHPNNKVPGVEACTGALGHGLAIAVGAALGAKRTGRPFRAYCVMGDGEQAEGSVWEAAMSASNYKLDNLWAVIDRNGLQISGSTEDVMALDDLAERWRAFGWDVEARRPRPAQLQAYFHSAGPREAAPPDRGPSRARSPFAENRADWHHHVPSDEQLSRLRSAGREEVVFMKACRKAITEACWLARKTRSSTRWPATAGARSRWTNSRGSFPASSSSAASPSRTRWAWRPASPARG